MAEDYYDDAAPAETSAPEEGGEEYETEGKVYTLPKAILMGKDFQPGDELVLKIEAIHDDRIEVSYAPAKEQESAPAEEAPPSGMGEGEMASMME